jgi:hypothetical protein
MKTFLKALLISTISIFLISCGGGGGGKSSDVAVLPPSSEYYVEAKINGVLKKFNGAVITQRYLESQSREIGITGWVGERSTPDGAFGIQLGSFIRGITLVPGTYQDARGAQVPAEVPIIASYTVANQSTFYSSVLGNFTVNITELNGTFTKGTFSGNIENMNNIGKNDVLSVTEGRFYAPHCTSNC